MTMHVASVLESREPKAEIGDHFTMERTNQHWPVQLCLLSGWKFVFTAICLRNKNVLKFEAGFWKKKEHFKNGLSLKSRF